MMSSTVRMGQFVQRIQVSTDGLDSEADFNQLFVIQDFSAVEDESRLFHPLEDLGVVVLFEFVPFGAHDEGVSALGGFVRIRLDHHQLLAKLLLDFDVLLPNFEPDSVAGITVVPFTFPQVHLDLVRTDFRVVDGQRSSFIQNVLGYVNCWRLSRVTRVLNQIYLQLELFKTLKKAIFMALKATDLKNNFYH